MNPENSQHTTNRDKLSPALPITAFGLAVIALGLLLWVRFIIVTDHPRTAIAKPAPSAEAQANVHTGHESPR